MGILEGHVAQAERHVAEGAEHINKQRQLIAKLEADGHDTKTARTLLAEFERTQQLHEDDLARIREEFGGAFEG